VKVLVTGAGGFLGQCLVRRLRTRGHTVRALLRRPDPALRNDDPGVEFVVADLRRADLAPVVAGIDAVIHAATTTTGDDFTIFSGTVIATERLLDALAEAPVRRLVLVSSFSVYDWRAVGGVLHADSPLLADPWSGGGYAAAKIWQERLARRRARASRIEFSILRPGFIWSSEAALPACFGFRVGRAFLVLGPRRTPPLTHVANCADALAAAVDAPGSADRVVNVVDGLPVSAWRWVGARLGSEGVLRIPVPGLVARMLVALVDVCSRLVFGSSRRLPSFCDPLRFAGRFGRVRCDPAPLRADLLWKPPLASFEACRTERACGEAVA